MSGTDMQVQQQSTAALSHMTTTFVGSGTGSSAALASSCARLARRLFRQKCEWHERGERNDAQSSECPPPSQRIYQKGGTKGHAALSYRLSGRSDANC